MKTIKVTREYTLDNRKVKEFMKEHKIEKKDFYEKIAQNETGSIYLLENLSVYKDNVRIIVNVEEDENESQEI